MRILTFVSGRRAKFGVLAGWLLVMAIAGSGGYASKLTKVQKNDQIAFLPGSAESVKTATLVKRFASGNFVTAVAVYRRDGGLTASDRRLIAADRAALNAHPPPVTAPLRPPQLSTDGTTALLVAQVTPRGKADKLKASVDGIRKQVDAHAGGGLQVRVSGAAGFSRDAVKVFSQIDGTLLAVTAALVFILLIGIYRSPIFWVIPFFAVAMAEFVSITLAYAMAKAGLTINGQTQGILQVLVFGAGTDYALLLVARFREELHHHEDRHEALRLALRTAGPAIAASGATVIAGLLCLSIAEVNGTSGLGPFGAMGIAVAIIAMLTLLPALLALAGRRAFWPFIPRAGTEAADATHGPWRRIADATARRPRRVWVTGLALLAICCLGLTSFNTHLTQGKAFRGKVEAVEGQALIARALPAGANAPTIVVVRHPSRVPAVIAALRRDPGVAAAGTRVERGPLGVRVDAILRADPYSTRAFSEIPRLRREVKAAGGPSALVGGPTAEERDLRAAAAHDDFVIPPLVLLVVFVILALLLRALLAPLLLISTVVLSFGAALGTGAFFFKHVFGFVGSDPSLPLFAFIFLVALGVDYNIFLMARVREESLRHGTREGMKRGLAVTGAVITSAGVVLAGTFSTLAVLPLVFLTEIGFVIAFGVLLDTLVVRSLLVPAVAFEVGPRLWWPSTLSKAIDRRR
ncbi:MAG TPA: MMPL family transporter [Solirubrobacteraceae bacterium]|nr:MMPL family transporter [Solirubrobacteraceae bacterium]